MNAECYPMTILPHLSRLYGQYLALGDKDANATDEPGCWYAARPGMLDWAHQAVPPVNSSALADALLASSVAAGYSDRARANVERLRSGARAVVTGQQVGLLGGPLLTLLKAATAIARAKQAEAATGVSHVPVFWLATEDHDFAEVNQVSLAGKKELETLRLEGIAHSGGEVGGVVFGPDIASVLDQACDLLAYAPITALLQEAYGAPGATFGSAFGVWMSRLFASHGLVIMDASTREFHHLGASTLKAAIENAEEYEALLLERTAELEAHGFHAQVLVKPGSSLLFLLSDGVRLPLRRTAEGEWKAGARTYTTGDLLQVLEDESERLSPNALLRPVFQDTILPVAAYVGGPAEIAYFAQTEVLYRSILGRVTPVLPRYSATLVEPAIASIMARQELHFPEMIAAGTPDALAMRFAARAMPIESKRKIAAAGNALDTELFALIEHMSAMDANLGRSANVSASKMRYQMNRLRRMSAAYEMQKQSVLRKQADTVMLHLFPEGHPQERVLAGAQLSASQGDDYPALIDRIVEAAADLCAGHAVLFL